MPRFGKKSKERLATCDERLQKVFNEVINYVDCSVLEGHRDERKQNQYFSEGKSKVQYPFGRHNTKPSRAVDVAPYPIDWNDWNQNFEVDDNKFDDFPHFELLN